MSGQILVGYDNSTVSERALRFAADRAKAGGHGLLIAHVLEWSPYSFLTPEEIEERHGRRQVELERAENAVLKPAVKSLEGSGLQVESVIKYGHVADTLCKIAADRKVSQIVIGRVGEAGLSARLFGSVAGSLAQAAPVPVTIVP